MEQYRQVVNDLKQILMFEDYKMRSSINALTSQIIVEDVPGEDDKKRALIPTNLYEEYSRIINERKNLLKSVHDQCRKHFDKLTDNGHLSVKSIQRIATAYLEAWTQTMLNPVWAYDHCINQSDIQRLANLATAVYLEAWLCNDQQNQQTPYNVYRHPFEPLGRRTISSPLSGAEKQKAKRAVEKEKSYHEAAKIMAKKQQRIPTRDPYVQNSKTGGNRMDLIHAASLYARRNKQLDILSLLVESTYIMTNAEDRRNNLTDKLRKACLRYQDFILETDKLRTGKTDSSQNMVRFVASSMLLHQLERENRFHFHARIVHRLDNKSVDETKYNKAAYNILVCSQQGLNGSFVAFQSTLPKLCNDLAPSKAPNNAIDDAVDILNIDSYIDAIFGVGNSIFTEAEQEKHAFMRSLFMKLLATLHSVYPPEEQHSWTKDDFYLAAKFYREDYPVTKELLKVRFPSEDPNREDYLPPEKRDSFYLHFMKIYQNMEKDPNSALSALRQAYASPKK